MRMMDRVGDNPIDEIESVQFEKFMVYLKNDFRITKVSTTPTPPKKLSAKSLSNAHCALTVFWKWAAKEYDIKIPFQVALIKAHTKPIHPLKGGDIEKLFFHAGSPVKSLTIKKHTMQKEALTNEIEPSYLPLLTTDSE